MEESIVLTKKRPVFAFAAFVVAICAVIYLQRSHRDRSPTRAEQATLFPAEEAVKPAPVAVASSNVASIPTPLVESSPSAVGLQDSLPDRQDPLLTSNAAAPSPTDSIPSALTKIVPTPTP